MGKVLHLRIAPDWDQVKAAWEPCQDMLTSSGLAEQAYTLCMVVQELLENAVKYGHYNGGQQVQLEVRVAPRDVTVEVKNPVAVDDGHLRRFDQTIQWIRGFQDPFEAYVERMKIVSSQPYAQGKSGLGLTRIAYEGRCLLDFYVDASNTLAVSAVYRREAA